MHLLPNGLEFEANISLWFLGAILAFGLSAAIATIIATLLSGRVAEGGPGKLSDTVALTERIRDNDVVHIIYVHGMRANGSGSSAGLISYLTGELKFSSSKSSARKFVDLGVWPSSATYFGEHIWRSQSEWKASRPFVDSITFTNSGKTVVIDEVNWWPLLFPLKSRFLLLPEHDVSGDDKKHLQIVGGSPATNGDPIFDWIGPGGRAKLRRPSLGGHAAFINRWLKQQIMNWGLSDAVIAMGSMRDYLHSAIDQAFGFAREHPEEGTTAYVLMSASLGSFVVFDALGSAENVRAVLDKTNDIYFLANQLSLLELSRLIGIPASPQAALVASANVNKGPSTNSSTSIAKALFDWAKKSPVAGHRIAESKSRQIIAFSDPSDLLTYPVPAIEGATVVNLYVRNAPNWLGLFVNPATAHGGHLSNRTVWKVLSRT